MDICIKFRYLVYNKHEFLWSLCLLLAVSMLVNSQAPDDALGHQCLEQPIPDDVFRLLDSSWYRALLPTSLFASAGWSVISTSSWRGSGNLCVRTLQSCSSSTIDWLVTQYINKIADINYALGITVDINGETSSCSGCSNSIKVYYYPSNGPVASEAQLNTQNYHLIGSVSFGSVTEEESLSFSLGGEFDRFYIGIVVENSCFTLRRLRVSYAFCPMGTVGLVIYPNTPIGGSAVDTFASCKANASVSPGSSLNITCNTDGTYSGSPSCTNVSGCSTGETCDVPSLASTSLVIPSSTTSHLSLYFSAASSSVALSSGPSFLNITDLPAPYSTILYSETTTSMSSATSSSTNLPSLINLPSLTNLPSSSTVITQVLLTIFSVLVAGLTGTAVTVVLVLRYYKRHKSGVKCKSEQNIRSSTSCTKNDLEASEYI